MRINFITGDLQVEASDIVEVVLREFDRQDFCEIYPVINTAKGFTRSRNVKIPEQGLYCIYKFNQPIYIGYSTNSIYNRIGRFLAGARGTERHDENHPASYKYARAYNDFKNLSIKFCSFNAFTLPDNLSIQDVEKELIYKLKPVFNKEIYKSLFVEYATLKLK